MVLINRDVFLLTLSSPCSVSRVAHIPRARLFFQTLRTWSTLDAYVNSDDRKYLLWVLSGTAPFIWNAEYYRIGVRSVTAVSTYLYIFPNGEQSQSRLFGKLVGTVSRLPIQERYVWFRFIYQEKHFQIMQSSFPFPFHIKYPSSWTR